MNVNTSPTHSHREIDSPDTGYMCVQPLHSSEGGRGRQEKRRGRVREGG